MLCKSFQFSFEQISKLFWTYLSRCWKSQATHVVTEMHERNSHTYSHQFTAEMPHRKNIRMKISGASIKGTAMQLMLFILFGASLLSACCCLLLACENRSGVLPHLLSHVSLAGDSIKSACFAVFQRVSSTSLDVQPRCGRRKTLPRTQKFSFNSAENVLAHQS